MDSFSTQNMQNKQDKQNNTDYFIENYSINNASTRIKRKCKKFICYSLVTFIWVGSYVIIFYAGYEYDKNNCNNTLIKEL